MESLTKLNGLSPVPSKLQLCLTVGRFFFPTAPFPGEECSHENNAASLHLSPTRYFNGDDFSYIFTLQWSRLFEDLYITKTMAANGVCVNVHDHGIALDEQKRKVQCKYCNKIVSGFSRLKCHLGGIRGDVAPCNEVPEDLKELMRKEVLDKKKGHLNNEVGELSHSDLPWKRNWNNGSYSAEQNRQETAHAGGSSAKRVKVSLASETSGTESVPLRSGPEDSSTRHFQKCVGRFFFETGTDVCAAGSPSFERMINAALASGQIGHRIPTPHELKGWILQDAVKEMQTYVEDIRNSWPNTGCSILLDGWTDGKGRELVNILVDCPKGAVYLRSVDISASVGNVDALELFFNEILKEVGVDNVVQIIAYSISVSMEMAGKQIMEKHRTLFWTVSASHCIELMLEKFGRMDTIKGVLEKAKTITKFVHGNAAVLKLLEDHNCGRALVKPSKFRSARPYLTLENIVSKKDNLMKLFVSLDWNTSIWASESEGQRVADLVKDRSFWTGALMVLKATTPLMRVLELINEGGTNKQRLGYIYETLDQMKETIKDEFNDRKSQYMPFWEDIDDIWNAYLHSPLHSAGYFLNPALFYSIDFYIDSEVASGLLCCIVRMAQNQHIQDLISLQVEEYREAKGAFSEGCSVHRRSIVPPATWWSNYGGQCPELQRLAIRILSQTCDGASRYGLKRNLAEQLLTKGRNRVEQQRLSDLLFVHYNLQLQSFELGTSNGIVFDEIDPMDDWVTAGEAQVVMSGEPSGRGEHGEGPSCF